VALEVRIGDAGSGKIRCFWVGFLLTVVSFGLYYYFWYYLLNEELKEIGIAKGDQNLGSSQPALSVAAVVAGWPLLVPPLISTYNFLQRIKRAQRLAGVTADREIHTTLAFLLYFPGSLFLLPLLFFFWYVTRHQNRALATFAGSPTPKWLLQLRP
jgi:hypothetical protein